MCVCGLPNSQQMHIKHVQTFIVSTLSVIKIPFLKLKQIQSIQYLESTEVLLILHNSCKIDIIDVLPLIPDLTFLCYKCKMLR